MSEGFVKCVNMSGQHRWATIMDGNVAGECRETPLGDNNGRKCRPIVPRSTVGQR